MSTIKNNYVFDQGVMDKACNSNTGETKQQKLHELWDSLNQKKVDYRMIYHKNILLVVKIHDKWIDLYFLPAFKV